MSPSKSTATPQRPSLARALAVALLLLVAVLLLARFVHLDADFPAGITWSGVLYTDEGWYSNAATRHVLTGEWYLKGDFNPAVNMPMGQLLHRASFEVFGLSLSAARFTPALAFSAAIVLVALLVRRRFGAPAALLTAALLASSYIGFAYSRLAIMEPVGMGFVALALYLADRAQGARAAWWSALAGLAVSAAILTKSTMIFAVPLVAWLVWAASGRGGVGAGAGTGIGVAGQRVDLRRRIDTVIPALLVPLFIVLGHHFAAAMLYPLDYTYFGVLNVGRRGVTGLADWLANIPAQGIGLLALGGGFLAVCAALVAAALWASRDFRRSALVHVLLACIVVYFASLTVVKYGPPRYFLPLLLPLSALAAIAAMQLSAALSGWSSRQQRHRAFALLPLLPLAALVLAGCAHIAVYMAKPEYSYRQMATGVADIIRSREGSVDGVVLFSDMADGVALVTGLRAVNPVIALDPMAVQIERYHPRYVLLHRHQDLMEKELQPFGARLVELGAWDIYGNYHLGEMNPRLAAWWPAAGNATNGSVAPPAPVARKNIQLFAVEWDAAATESDNALSAGD